MNSQPIQPTQDISRPWTIVQILPDAHYYPVAKTVVMQKTTNEFCIGSYQPQNLK